MITVYNGNVQLFDNGSKKQHLPSACKIQERIVCFLTTDCSAYKERCPRKSTFRSQILLSTTFWAFLMQRYSHHILIHYNLYHCLFCVIKIDCFCVIIVELEPDFGVRQTVFEFFFFYTILQIQCVTSFIHAYIFVVAPDGISNLIFLL